MWKRDEAVKPTTPGTPAGPAAPAQQTQASVPAQPDSRRHQLMERDVVNIGKSVVIKGELNGSEDLTVEGHVEGVPTARADLTASRTPAGIEPPGPNCHAG